MDDLNCCKHLDAINICKMEGNYSLLRNRKFIVISLIFYDVCFQIICYIVIGYHYYHHLNLWVIIFFQNTNRNIIIFYIKISKKYFKTTPTYLKGKSNFL